MTTSIKTRRILRIFLFAFLVIVLRIWHLGFIQREEKQLEAQKPQQRTILIRANRGSICDRFHVPLALNQIHYNAAIYYSQIVQIPRVTWNGTVKIYARKEYIRELSKMLANVLSLDAEQIENVIHSKASLFPHVPFLIKPGLSEEEYYRLKMLEKDWPGVYAEIGSKRFYPLAKTGCHIVGTMGAISAEEYSAIAKEMSELQKMADLYELEESDRLAALKEKAYAIDDLVGKTGIEAQFEEDLRGFFGKKIFEVDQKGCFLREIGRKEAIAGKQVVLSISSELQQFAENLLIQDEKTRDGRSLGIDPIDKVKKTLKQPWIKGGAIVALDPKTGEILALASHPRFDPNDFISRKSKQIDRWLESERFISAVWDGIDVLMRERNCQEETQTLTWDFYLDSVLPKDGPLRAFFHRLDDIKSAIQLQEDYEAMLYFTRSNLPLPPDIQKRLDAVPLSPQDKLFAVDLCRVAVYAPAFTDALIAQIGSMKLSDYRALCQAFQRHEAQARKKEKEVWKERERKQFLAEKQREWCARPYADDSDQKELFAKYWEENRISKLVSPEFPEDLIRTFRSFSQLNRPLFGKYKNKRIEKDLAGAFYPLGGFGFNRSFAFQTTAPQGSIFKLVTAYEALRQGKSLTLIDAWSPQGVAYALNQTLYPRFYKGGRLPRSAAMAIGKIDLIGAIEQTSNPYFSILAGDCLGDPEDLATAARLLGFGEKTGVELPGEKRGKIPNDLKTNRTGLYSTAIGQHTLLTTPLQTACMLAAIANGGKLLKPKIVREIVGLTPDRHPLKAFATSSYFAKEELSAIGIPFPIFTSLQPLASLPAAIEPKVEYRRSIPMEEKIRNPLLEGMNRVVWGIKGSARPTAIKGLLSNPFLMRDYLSLQHQIVGKTGTAELACQFSVNYSPPQLYKHLWFGIISFTDTRQEDPELVVVIFLRYGDAGKEAAPLAAQMIHKWREIKKKAHS